MIIEGASSWSWYVYRTCTYVTRRICFHGNVCACVIRNACTFFFIESTDVFIQHFLPQGCLLHFVLFVFQITSQTCRFQLVIPHCCWKHQQETDFHLLETYIFWDSTLYSVDHVDLNLGSRNHHRGGSFFVVSDQARGWQTEGWVWATKTCLQGDGSYSNTTHSANRPCDQRAVCLTQQNRAVCLTQQNRAFCLIQQNRAFSLSQQNTFSKIANHIARIKGFIVPDNSSPPPPKKKKKKKLVWNIRNCAVVLELLPWTSPPPHPPTHHIAGKLYYQTLTVWLCGILDFEPFANFNQNCPKRLQYTIQEYFTRNSKFLSFFTRNSKFLSFLGTMTNQTRAHHLPWTAIDS